MDLREIGEFGLIARIRNRLPTLPLDVFEGIGDADLLVKEVHVDLALISAHLLGRKALAVNLSDIAAMGARPRFALISVALPARTSV